MIKVALTEDFSAIRIVENDRGQWEVLPHDVRSMSYDLIGFGGEDSISIFLSPMHTGRVDVLVVKTAVDSYLRSASGTVVADWQAEKIDALINKLIAEVTDYPEEL